MSEKNKNSNYYYANVSEHEWDILTPLEGKMITRIRAFEAMIDRATGARRMMLYTTQQLAQDWKTSERSIMRARAGLLEKGLVEKKEWKNRTILVPVFVGWSDAACHDATCHPDATCHVGGDTTRHLDMTQRVTPILYIKELEDKNKKIRKEEREEGLTPLVASLPSPSAHCVSDLAHSSATSSTREIQTQVQNPPFASDPAALEAYVDQLVAKKLAEASRSLVATAGHSDTRTDVVQGNGGGKMETSQGLPVVVGKAKATRAKKSGTEEYYKHFSEADFFWPDNWSAIGKEAMAEWVAYKTKIGKPCLLQSYQTVIKKNIADEILFRIKVDNSVSVGHDGGPFPPRDQHEIREARRIYVQEAVMRTDVEDDFDRRFREATEASQKGRA